ncbi:MAG: hypothetical protein ACRYF3_14045 [Janthinobacterium lividum]
MSTRSDEEPGSAQVAESATEQGYGNDTGFAAEAEEADENSSPDEDTDDDTDD